MTAGGWETTSVSFAALLDPEFGLASLLVGLDSTLVGRGAGFFAETGLLIVTLFETSVFLGGQFDEGFQPRLGVHSSIELAT